MNKQFVFIQNSEYKIRFLWKKNKLSHEENQPIENKTIFNFCDCSFLFRTSQSNYYHVVNNPIYLLAFRKYYELTHKNNQFHYFHNKEEYIISALFKFVNILFFCEHRNYIAWLLNDGGSVEQRCHIQGAFVIETNIVSALVNRLPKKLSSTENCNSIDE